MTSQELRASFVDFFVNRGHKHISSASLIPDQMATTLFTIAIAAAVILFIPMEGVFAATAPGVVLANYESALAHLAVPDAQTYFYNVEQVGVSNLLENHRIYRDGMSVRDETIVLDGHTLSVPLVRVLSAPDRYALTNLAPTPARYQFDFVSTAHLGNVVVYLFRTTSLGTAAFTVDEVAIDARTFLPRTIRFHSSGVAARGTGLLTYAPVGSSYWMIQSAVARAPVGSLQTREYITWSAYQFPRSLPPSTFGRFAPLPGLEGSIPSPQ
ncbi:MAG TPA: hypothetical protein VGZ00_04470 [Candidatus Baltobacteraceae bacterium]|jgi:hypothetical protein|nr:hypothetical protein [Candidatus Baltobacteraceae bacterium]